MQKIRKGDEVVVLTGKDKGRKGSVLQVLPKDNRAVVSGVNVVKRHQRQTPNAEAASFPKRRRSTCRTWPCWTPKTPSRPESASAWRATARCVSPNVPEK